MPKFQLTGPDGGNYEVDAPDEDAAVSAVFGDAGGDPYKGAATAKMNDMNPVRAGIIETGDRYLHGATFGAWDKAAPYIHGAGDFIKTGGENWDESLKRGQALEDEIRRRAGADHPIISGAADVAGNLGTSVVTGGAVANALGKAGVGATLLQDGMAGVVTGGATAAGDGENPLVGAGLGGAGGVAGNLIGKGVGAAAQFFKKPNVPTIADRAAEKAAAYSEFENGGTYTPDIYDALRANIQQELAKPGMAYSRRMHPKTRTLMQELDDMQRGGVSPASSAPPPGSPVPIAAPALNPTVDPGALQNLRVLANDAIRGGEARTGYAVRNAFDNTLLNPPPGVALSANGVDMGAKLQHANKVNQILQKAELVQNLLNKAGAGTRSTGSGGNINNKTRQALDKALAKRRDWTPDELAGFSAASEPTRLEEGLRKVGKIAPGGNGLMTALNVGAWMHDPKNMALSVLAQGAKGAADRSSMRRGEQVLETILNGGQKVVSPPAPLRQFIERNHGGIGGAAGAMSSYPAPAVVERK